MEVLECRDALVRVGVPQNAGRGMATVLQRLGQTFNMRNVHPKYQYRMSIPAMVLDGRDNEGITPIAICETGQFLLGKLAVFDMDVGQVYVRPDALSPQVAQPSRLYHLTDALGVHNLVGQIRQRLSVSPEGGCRGANPCGAIRFLATEVTEDVDVAWGKPAVGFIVQ